MARAAERTEILTADERRAYTKRLREIADLIEDFDDLFDNKDAWVFRKPSLTDGLRRIDAFASDLRRTANSVIAGKPLKKSSKKSDLRF